MKKRRNAFILFALLMLSLAVIGCSGKAEPGEPSQTAVTQSETGGQGATQDPIKLAFGSWVPATNPAHINGFVPFAEKISSETSGLLTIDVQPGGTLGTSDSVVQDVSGGVYDIGFGQFQRWPDTALYKMTILDLPFAFVHTDDHLKKAEVVERYASEFVEDEFEKLNLKLMGVYLASTNIILSTSPIHSVEDLKGKTMRLPSSIWEPIVKEWGAVPIAIHQEDAYTALERGTLDVLTYASAGYYSNKFHEPAPYISKLPLSNSSSFLVMNLEKYNSLPPELRQRFEDEYNAFVPDALNLTYARDAEKDFEKAQQEGAEIIEPTDEQLQGFMAAGKNTWVSWVEEANHKGYNGQELLDGFIRIMKEEGIEPPFEF